MTKSQDTTHMPSLVLTMLIFVALMAFVAFSYFHYQLEREEKTGVSAQDIHLGSADHVLGQQDGLQHWRLEYISGETCDRDCENVLYTMQQVKKALGEESGRVTLAQSLPKNHRDAHMIYLIDPAGMVAGAYADSKDPMIILKDLKHVLEVSAVG